MVIEIEGDSNDERIDYLAALIAEIFHEETGCPQATSTLLKNVLIQFAQEIKRQSIEP